MYILHVGKYGCHERNGYMMQVAETHIQTQYGTISVRMSSIAYMRLVDVL